MRKVELGVPAPNREQDRPKRRSCTRNTLEDIDGKYCKNNSASPQSSVNDRGLKYGPSLADARSSLEEDHDRLKTNVRDGEEELRVIRSVNYRFRKAIKYRTYRRADTSPKFNRTLLENVAEIEKNMKTQMGL